jgi:hypothetical protein
MTTLSFITTVLYSILLAISGMFFVDSIKAHKKKHQKKSKRMAMILLISAVIVILVGKII